MDRLEYIRQIVDKEIAKLQEEEKKYAYIHTYGVAQVAALMASIEQLDTEICCIAAMLHDLSIYVLNCPHRVHAEKSAELAKDILTDSKLFTAEEIARIVHAIYVHSDKMKRDDTLLAEVLKDSDVLQHYLYNVNIPLAGKERYRLFYILEKLEQIKNTRSQA